MKGFDTKCRFISYKGAWGILEHYNIPFQEWNNNEEFEIRIDIEMLAVSQKEILIQEFNITHIDEYDYIIFYN